MKSWEMEQVRSKCRMDHVYADNCDGEGRGRKGGLRLMLKNIMEVEIRKRELNFIDSRMSEAGKQMWRFTGVYGCPDDENKGQTCLALEDLAKEREVVWLCGGDFISLILSV